MSCILVACTATKAAFGVGLIKKNKDKDTTERINKAANKVIIANPFKVAPSLSLALVVERQYVVSQAKH